MAPHRAQQVKQFWKTWEGGDPEGGRPERDDQLLGHLTPPPACAAGRGREGEGEWRCKERGGSKKCGVCGQELPKTAFPASQWRNAGRATRKWALRCTACHCCATCSQIKDVRAFGQEAKTCIVCERNIQPWHCDACDKMLQEKMFNKNMLLRAKRWDGKSVCLACAARGFSTRDVTAYHCAECGEQGHLKFPAQMLKNYKRRGRRAQLVCTECCRKFATMEMNLKDKQLCA